MIKFVEHSGYESESESENPITKGHGILLLLGNLVQLPLKPPVT